ncbi:hypothetical protein DEDE109153_02085 [Deinococcus deserti]
MTEERGETEFSAFAGLSFPDQATLSSFLPKVLRPLLGKFDMKVHARVLSGRCHAGTLGRPEVPLWCGMAHCEHMRQPRTSSSAHWLTGWPWKESAKESRKPVQQGCGV